MAIAPKNLIPYKTEDWLEIVLKALIHCDEDKEQEGNSILRLHY